MARRPPYSQIKSEQDAAFELLCDCSATKNLTEAAGLLFIVSVVSPANFSRVGSPEAAHKALKGKHVKSRRCGRADDALLKKS